MSPAVTAVVMLWSPTTAGTSSALAMMAVCEVALPRSVTKPFTSSRLMLAVSEGERSWAAMMHSTLIPAIWSTASPARLAMMRRVTSRMSAARSER